MNPRRALFHAAAILGLSLLPAPGFAADTKPKAAPAEKIFNSESFTLDNGLQVVVIPNHRAPVVTQMLVYKSGAIDEPHGLSGVAHFVEHLMFKGTEKIPPDAFSPMISAMGGDNNAFTTQDFTAYHETIAADRLEKVMEMEADRMTGLVFPPDDVAHERNVVIQERRERTDDDPRSYFNEQLRAALFVNHPYGNPVVGWMQEVDSLERDHVMDYYQHHYAPNNAILIVSGDITAEKLKPLAEKIFGPIPRRDVPARRWTEVPPLNGLPRLTLRDPSIRQPVFQRLYRMPSCVQDKKQCLALQVLQDIMDGGAATRLYRILVSEQKLATSIDFSYDGEAVSDGTASLAATPREGVSLETLEKAVDDVLRALIKDGVSAQELRESKDRLKDAAVFARDGVQGPAMIFAEALATGASLDDIEYWPQQIESVTAVQVQDVAKTFLDPDHYGKRPYVTGLLLPAEEAKVEAPKTEEARPEPRK